MDDQAQRSELMSALVTEHFVLQTATSTSVNESASRASLYLMSLSSALVAMGFVSQTRDAFVPFVATVLPGLFVMGVFTVFRLVDNAVENLQFLAGIARIRGYYRRLTPDAAEFFAPEDGRWPEPTTLAQRRGPLPLLFTSASMIAFINSIVAGAGVALLANRLLAGDQTGLAVLIGVAVALALMTGFFTFQRRRYRVFDPRGGPWSATDPTTTD
ncbi:MAG TPA: hypothetical protein VFH02_10570 [Jiangellaceae bacterium]|nr:hypothetical protein [Jiangellaceae bacterium]